MQETITFHFEGSLADTHRMNFYESARFQYAAARLFVKLSQFRQSGKFVQKITNRSNFDIQLAAHEDGSFNINIEDASKQSDTDPFLDISLSDLLAYVSERLVGKIDETKLADLKITGRAELGTADIPAKNTSKALDMIINSASEDQHFSESLPPYLQDLVKRRESENFRAERLQKGKVAIEKIDFARSQKLIAMSAPLLSEMATPLRKSADTLQVRSSTHSSSQTVLFLNQQMAREIETAIVDEEITPILGNITQFNKENGYGKIRLLDNQKILSFNIPSDLLSMMKKTLIDSMKKDLVYLQTYFVRDRSNEAIRLIAVGLLSSPPA